MRGGTSALVKMEAAVELLEDSQALLAAVGEGQEGGCERQEEGVGGGL
jgi:hypothetical protein